MAMPVYNNFLLKSFREKVILFPYDGLRGLTTPTYPINEAFIGITMAAALFPQKEDEQQFMGYVAQYFSDFIKQFETSDALALSDNKKQLMAQLASFPLLFFGSSHAFYNALLQWKPFSQKGKGSLRERFDQGLFFGDVYKRFLFDNISIKEAINDTIMVIKQNLKKESITDNPFPSLENNNIYTNYWPRFKSIAWLWYAIRHLVPGPVHEQYVEICNSEFSTINGMSPHKGIAGWSQILTESFFAYIRIKKDGLVDKNGIDTWRYSDTLDNTEDFFPKENLKSLNDIFTHMSC